MRANSTKDAQNNKKAATPEEVEKISPGLMSFIDCTEQQIPRPESKRRRKADYPGKRKRHAVKTQLVVNNKGIVIHKTGHRKGHRHDYNIWRYKNNHPVTPKQVVSVFDLGYLGIEKTIQSNCHRCHQKEEKQELPAEEKECNQYHSRKRMVIEHTICKMKKYRILADIFRNRLKN